jgi:hypothetical protein
MVAVKPVRVTHHYRYVCFLSRVSQLDTIISEHRVFGGCLAFKNFTVFKNGKDPKIRFYTYYLGIILGVLFISCKRRSMLYSYIKLQTLILRNFDPVE